MSSQNPNPHIPRVESNKMCITDQIHVDPCLAPSKTTNVTFKTIAPIANKKRATKNGKKDHNLKL